MTMSSLAKAFLKYLKEHQSKVTVYLFSLYLITLILNEKSIFVANFLISFLPKSLISYFSNHDFSYETLYTLLDYFLTIEISVFLISSLFVLSAYLIRKTSFDDLYISLYSLGFKFLYFWEFLLSNFLIIFLFIQTLSNLSIIDFSIKDILEQGSILVQSVLSLNIFILAIILYNLSLKKERN